MSFVGTRPEAVKYVEKYKPEYMATLLLPAGITSEASIRYKDEAELLNGAEDVDKGWIRSRLLMVYVWIHESEVIITTRLSAMVVIVCRKIQSSFWQIMRMFHRT